MGSIIEKMKNQQNLTEAFDSENTSWADEYIELKGLLDESEYAAARESTLTAFYTPKVVIDAMYEAISTMGFVDGNILEPSCGVGHFIGLLPDSMENAKMYGIEVDEISGRIAKQLYQKNSIIVDGYENVKLHDSFFDIAIGNVPFGDFKVSDKRYDKNRWLIHDYFFGKTLDKVRAGGVIAFITSKGTMDKASPAVRKYIAQRADLIGAIRLPNNTFTKNAGTKVTSDILFLQKRDRITDIEPDWIYLDKDENGIEMNSYFVNHPEMILGSMKMVQGRFRMESSCIADDSVSLKEQLHDAISNIHAEIESYEREDEELDEESVPADPQVKNFSFTIYDGKVYFRENSKMYPIDTSETAMGRIKGMIKIRDSVRQLIELQSENYPEADIEKEQQNLSYRAKTRFAKFYNLPELMTMFKEVADIQMFDSFSREYQVELKHAMRYTVPLGGDVGGNIIRLDNALDNVPKTLESVTEQYENVMKQLENAKEEVDKPFVSEDELQQKLKRLDELNVLLSLDEKCNEIVDDGTEPEEKSAAEIEQER